MSDPESDSESAAMAVAMGFTTFGAPKPNKKRKFNTATDAFIDGQGLEKIDRGGKKGKGSGGNDIPLGRMRTLGVKNEEEINIELEDEDQDDGGVLLGSSKPNQDMIVEGREIREEGEEGPVYLDTSQPAPTSLSTEAKAAQARIDAITGVLSPADANLSRAEGVVEVGLPAFIATRLELPNRHPPSPGLVHWGSGLGCQKGGRRDGGGRNEKWYVDYYDAAFNENPWAELEREKGLGTLGSWLEKGHWPRKGEAV